MSNSEKGRNIPELNFGSKVRRQMDEKGFDYNDLVGITGASRATVSDLVNNNRDPKLSYVVRLAAAFDMSLDQLVFGVGEGDETITTVAERYPVYGATDSDLEKCRREKEILEVRLESMTEQRDTFQRILEGKIN